VVTAIPTGVGFWSGFIAIGNLVPRRGGDDETVPSDGRQILELLKRPAKGDDDAILLGKVSCLNEIERHKLAADLALSGRLNSKFGPWLLVSAVYAIYRTEGPAKAIDCYFSRRAEVEEGADLDDELHKSGMAWLKSTVAGCAMRADDPEWTEISDQYSADAVASLPNEPAIGGLRGSWMVRNDQVKEGLRLLTQAIRKNINSPTRAEYCKDLALGWRTLGDEVKAFAFEDLESYLSTRV
jgi:hypothetical protein